MFLDPTMRFNRRYKT